ncbi:hypothetical protein [Streptomyces virginiae]|uniref:hypothetical protein n=1 Tax=Streptomyces virginiae TaxID=1961 RepID=UPI0036FF7CD6
MTANGSPHRRVPGLLPEDVPDFAVPVGLFQDLEDLKAQVVTATVPHTLAQDNGLETGALAC